MGDFKQFQRRPGRSLVCIKQTNSLKKVTFLMLHLFNIWSHLSASYISSSSLSRMLSSSLCHTTSVNLFITKLKVPNFRQCVLSAQIMLLYTVNYIWFHGMSNPCFPSYKSQPVISTTQLAHILFLMMKLLVPAFLLLALGHLATAEVVQSFGTCSNFFFMHTPPTGPSGSDYRRICQKRTYTDGYEFATLYDTSRKIPVYSAYKFQKHGSCKSNAWYIEPQVSCGFSLTLWCLSDLYTVEK